MWLIWWRFDNCPKNGYLHSIDIMNAGNNLPILKIEIGAWWHWYWGSFFFIVIPTFFVVVFFVCVFFKAMGILLTPPTVSSSVRPSVCLSRYLLLHHWAEFYQTCYITSPHGKGVQEKHYFSVRASVRASVVRPFVSHYLLLNHWKEFNHSSPKPLEGIQPQLLHHFPSWLGCARATLFFRASVHLSVTLSPMPLGGIQPNLLHHFPSW